MSEAITYRGYVIEPAYVGWQFRHEDWDGAPNNTGEGPADRRYGHADSSDACKAMIDEQIVDLFELGKEPCATHCSACDGLDHHWGPYGDTVDGVPVLSCKHCDAVRDEDDDCGSQ